MVNDTYRYASLELGIIICGKVLQHGTFIQNKQTTFVGLESRRHTFVL